MGEGRHTDCRLHCPRCCRALGLLRSEKHTWSRYTAGCCEAGNNTLADELCVGASLKRGRFEGTCSDGAFCPGGRTELTSPQWQW